MNEIFVIHEEDEIITARDTMENAVAACINRIAICGYICEGFYYDEDMTTITYRDHKRHEIKAIVIEHTTFKEGV